MVLSVTPDSILFGGLGLFLILTILFFEDVLKLSYKQTVGIFLTYIVFIIFLGFIYGHDYKTVIMTIVFALVSLCVILFKKFGKNS